MLNGSPIPLAHAVHVTARADLPRRIQCCLFRHPLQQRRAQVAAKRTRLRAFRIELRCESELISAEE